MGAGLWNRRVLHGNELWILFAIADVARSVQPAMLSLLVHHLIPASLYGRQTAFPILSRSTANSGTVNAPISPPCFWRNQKGSYMVVCARVSILQPASNMCQLACPGCVHSTRNEELKVFDWPNGTLSENRFSALLKLYGPYAIGVYFCNYGEPLLNLNTPKLIRIAKTYLLGTALSTSLSVRRFDAEAYRL
jgi:hypothetical protein